VIKQVNSGGGAMPSFKGKLTDAQIQELATYVSDNAGKS
jgi:mono/diheme cytochrome c family protein